MILVAKVGVKMIIKTSNDSVLACTVHRPLMVMCCLLQNILNGGTQHLGLCGFWISSAVW
jgi:hypothetical protein